VEKNGREFGQQNMITEKLTRILGWHFCKSRQTGTCIFNYFPKDGAIPGAYIHKRQRRCAALDANDASFDVDTPLPECGGELTGEPNI
jgi:hypothetical protein